MDWEYVANKDVESADQKTVQLLSGLHPALSSSRKKLRTALAISKKQIQNIANEYQLPVNYDTDVEEEDEEFDDEAPIISSPKAFLSFSMHERIKVYQRMLSLDRPLLSLQLITRKISIYNDLNTILGHVRTQLCSQADSRLRFGRQGLILRRWDSCPAHVTNSGCTIRSSKRWEINVR